MPIPFSDSMIPAATAPQLPTPLLQALLLLVFVAHLLLMNVVLGGVIIAAVRTVRTYLGFTPSGLTSQHDPLTYNLAKKLAGVMALAVNLGVASLLFVQLIYGQFFYVSTVILAVTWLSLTAVLILGYYGLYIFSYRHDAFSTGTRMLLLLVVGALFLWVGFAMSMNATLSLTPERWTVYFENPTGTFLNLGEPSLLPRYLHFVLAAVAVAGLFSAVSWRLRVIHGVADQAEAAPHVTSSMAWFTNATLAQLVVGPLFLVSLPMEVGAAFLGGNPMATHTLLTALASVAVTLYFAGKRKVFATAAMTVLTVALMALTRESLRQVYLGEYLARVPDGPFDWRPFLLFAASLVLFGAMTLYLVRLAWQATRPNYPVLVKNPTEAMAEQCGYDPDTAPATRRNG